MIKKEKARHGAGTPERAKVGAGLARSSTSNGQHTIDDGRRQIRVADLLSMGQENAINIRHLKALLHLPSREVRLMIWRERRQGIPILSDNVSGYFLPANEAERARFVRSMRARAVDILRTADAVEQGAAEHD